MRVEIERKRLVATSNAGSQHIIDLMKKGESLTVNKQHIVDQIIEENTFKPELLNRFDGIVVFHPLADIHLKGVARIMLERLVWKLKEKGITLVINDALLEVVIRSGKDLNFGARPLNRVIQDVVEKKISDGLIAGIYTIGSTIEFSALDFK